MVREFAGIDSGSMNRKTRYHMSVVIGTVKIINKPERQSCTFACTKKLRVKAVKKRA